MTLKNSEAFFESCCSRRSKPTSSMKRISGEIYCLSFMWKLLSARLAINSVSISEAVVYRQR